LENVLGRRRNLGNLAGITRNWRVCPIKKKKREAEFGGEPLRFEGRVVENEHKLKGRIPQKSSRKSLWGERMHNIYSKGL